MFSSNFGIEIEFTGITRERAAEVAAKHLDGTIVRNCSVLASDSRLWKFTYDSSIMAQKRERGKITHADRSYGVELVSPILNYHEDIETLQELVRKLRKAGGITNSTTGIHIHLDGASHTARSVRNFVNIVASKNDLFYKALQIEPDRMRYCKKFDEYLVVEMNKIKPKTLEDIATIWYQGYTSDRHRRYHQSRYHFLNLHSFFYGNRTLELRGFNSVLHAGKIRSYIVLALTLNHQALTQKYQSAKSRKSRMRNSL